MEPAPQEPGDGQEALVGLTLSELHLRLRRHALWKIAMCERTAILLMQGRRDNEIRSALGLVDDREQYRSIQRWLREAMAAEDLYGPPAPRDLREGLEVIQGPPPAGPERRSAA